MRRTWLFALALAACKLPSDTESPDGDGALDRIESTGPSTPDAAEGGAGPNAATDKPKVLPKVRDRDPEEEKKKMALSRQRSAEGRKQLAAGRLPEAIDHSRQALKIHEQNVDAMLVIAEAYYRQQKYELVQAVTSSALSVDAKIRTPQETSRAHNLKGFAFVAMGDENLATQSFRKAAEADEKNASAWNNLGTRYMQAGDVATAKQCFTYAIELQPKLAKAHLNLGAALRAEGKWQDAEKSLNTALKLRPNWAEAFFNLGVLYLDADPYPGLDTVGRLNKSIQFLTKYRELAVADGPEGPGNDPTAGIARSGKKGTSKIAPGPAAVSKARAEDYIRVAKKGIEREERKAERERSRSKDGAAKPKDGTTPEPTTSEPTAPTKPETTPVKPEPAKPGGTKPEPTKPGATKPEPSTPAKPEPTTPAKPEPTKPTAPGTAPTTTPPAKPQTPNKPGGATPPPAAPKPQAPAAPAPPATPPNASPSPTPTPTQPSAPPQSPKPQAPKPQTPKPQTPGKHADARAVVRDSEAWNPRASADTHLAGAHSGRARDREAHPTMIDSVHDEASCDRACAPSRPSIAIPIAISSATCEHARQWSRPA